MKFKRKKEKKQPASQFPNIYRFITEKKNLLRSKKPAISLLNRHKLKKILFFASVVAVFAIIVVLTVGILVLGIYTHESIVKSNSVNMQRQSLQSQINFWQSIAEKYDGYKDAYFRIAFLEYRLGNFEKSKNYNQKALILDPNFDDAKKLEAILDKE